MVRSGDEGGAIWRQPGRGVLIKEAEGAAVDGLSNVHTPCQGSVVSRYWKPGGMVGVKIAHDQDIGTIVGIE